METFDTTAPITVVLNIPAGHLRFTAGEQTGTTVEVRPSDASKARDVRAAEKTTVAYADGVLRIEAASTKNQIFGNSGFVDVTVRVPAGSRVEATAAAADFRGTGRFGDVVLKAAQGPIDIDEATGVRVDLAAGDVSVGRLTGPAEVTVSKGDIRIVEAVRGKLVLRTRAGAISVGAAAGVSAALDAGISYGRIDNRLRNDGTVELDIHASTEYGDITAHSL
jgi:DUF4097 and DUF4098 domain-containing protein YvlB